MKDRISLRIDEEIQGILDCNRQSGETTAACIRRLLKEADELTAGLEKIKIEQADSHERTRKMLASFLDQMKLPFGQISDHLEVISNKLGR